MHPEDVAVTIDEFTVSSIVARRNAVAFAIDVDNHAAVADDLKNDEIEFSVVSLASSEAGESEMNDISCRICMETIRDTEFSDGNAIRLGCR